MFIGCWQLAEWGIVAWECCDSCHVDHDEYGYDLCEIPELDPLNVHVCCSVSNYIDKHPECIEAIKERAAKES